MQVIKYWIARTREGAELMVQTFTEAAKVYNADLTVAKQLTEEEAKAWKAKVRKERKKK